MRENGSRINLTMHSRARWDEFGHLRSVHSNVAEALSEEPIYELLCPTLGVFDDKLAEVKKIHAPKHAPINRLEQAIPPEMKKLEFLKYRGRRVLALQEPGMSGTSDAGVGLGTNRCQKADFVIAHINSNTLDFAIVSGIPYQCKCAPVP